MSSTVASIVSRRPLHYVFKIGNRRANLEFFRDILGMKVLRHEEFTEGCKAACNGLYDGKWSKTMIGYGSEDDHFVMELTYNYNIGSYKLGNDFGGLTIFSSTIRDEVIKRGYSFQEESGGFVLKSPDGYKFVIIEDKSERDPVKRVALNVSNMKRSSEFWKNIAGLSIHSQSEKKTELSSGNNHCNLEIVEISDPIDRASGYGRIAFAVPREDLPGIEKQMNDNHETVLTPLVKLDTPGKATVEVVICADPDGHEICFVGDEAFRELSQIDKTSNDALEKAIEMDKSDEWFSKKGKPKVEA